MRKLPADARGYPVPWFVATINGARDFRIADNEKFELAIRARRCWICGQGLGKCYAFVTTLMGVALGYAAEPPSHLECAKFAARSCPFLTNPAAKYRDAKLPADVSDPQGAELLRHNPGVTVLWVTETYAAQWLGAGALLRFGEPRRVQFWREGRLATRAEVIAARESEMRALHVAIAARAEAGLTTAGMVTVADREAMAIRMDEIQFWLPDDAGEECAA
jgi:hypothetical protein